MFNRKWVLVLLLCLGPVAAFASTTALTPKDIIFNFYKSYFSYLHSKSTAAGPDLAYSTSFNKLFNYNLALCRPFPDEICGWGSDGDIYLNAQDYDDNLTIENTHFTITESPQNVITVSFNLFPSEKPDQHDDRIISYNMIFEQNQWVVDDIIYEHKSSSRQDIESENQSLIDELKSEGKAVPRE